ncbi:MAG: hypothetical protein P8Y25_05925 [Chromatiaceae bacterium]
MTVSLTLALSQRARVTGGALRATFIVRIYQMAQALCSPARSGTAGLRGLRRHAGGAA